MSENQGAGDAYQNSPRISGNNDNKVSEAHKVWIVEPGLGICVCALLGEGSSEELTVNWTQPFADESLGSEYEKADGSLVKVGEAVGMAAGLTTRTTLATRQKWEGNSPTAYTLNLVLYALADAQAEVEDAIQALRELSAPDTARIGVGGRVPPPVAVNIGRKAIIDDLIIKSVSIPLDGEKTKDGLRVRASVSLQLETLEARNLDKVREMAG